MERGFYKIYLARNGFKIPFITYALTRTDAVTKAVDNYDDLPAVQVYEIQGPFSSLMAIENA